MAKISDTKENTSTNPYETSSEIFLESSSSLVSVETWDARIRDLRSMTSFRKNLLVKPKHLAEVFRTAVMKRLNSTKQSEACILLSGGVDSTAIATVSNLPCITIAARKSPDLLFSRMASEKLGIMLHEAILDDKSIKLMLPEIVSIIGSIDVTKVCVAVVVWAGLKQAKELGFKTVFSGLGSEELFAGYNRHIKAKDSGQDLNEECWSGLFAMYDRDLCRDFSIATHFDMHLATPFLDKELILMAMSIPGDNKICKGFTKYVFRQASVLLGVPEDIAWRKKLAAQYGARITKALDRISKAEGFKRKKEYLLSIAPGTQFQKKVWAATMQVPEGRTASYGALAKLLGASPRSVGQALKQNPYSPVVPCHRIINSDGSIGGFNRGEAKKKALLDLENQDS